MLIKNTNQRKINPVLEILEDRNAPGAMLQLNTLLPLDLLGKVTLMALNPMAGNHKQRNTLGSDNNLAILLLLTGVHLHYRQNRIRIGIKTRRYRRH